VKAKRKRLDKRADMRRNIQLIRTLSIIRDLDRVDGVDLYELAERYGTNVRTIRRDLEGLQSVGLPITEEPGDGKKKRWRVAFKDKLSQLADLLEVTHYLALRVAMDGGIGKTSNLFTALEDLSDKIESQLGTAQRKQLHDIMAAFHSYEKFAYKKAALDVFWPLITAISGRRMCRVVYRTPIADAKDKEIRVLPLKIFVHQQAVYVHAYVPKHHDVAVFNLQRLQRLQVLDEIGEIPRGYHPDKLEASAFGVFVGKKPVTYKLRFSADIAPYIRERSWHPSEKLREHADGRLDLTFTCGESYEVSAWVASWRDGVEVLEPASLRQELGALGRYLIDSYGATS
jgi:predicted DNA-binding transcriptional regulator YafY